MSRFWLPVFLMAGIAPQVLVAQVTAPESLPVGRDFSAKATAATIRFDLPEPVGWIEVALEFSPVRETLTTLVRPDHVQLTGGRVTFRDQGTVELPPEFLGCIPFPRPRETRLSLVYPNLRDVEGDWFTNFFSYVDILYGPSMYKPDRDVLVLETREYPRLRITLKGNTLRRAVFTVESGDPFRIEPVPDACSAELIEWLK